MLRDALGNKAAGTHMVVEIKTFVRAMTSIIRAFASLGNHRGSV